MRSPVLAGHIVGVNEPTQPLSVAIQDQTFSIFTSPATRDAAFDAVPPNQRSRVEDYLGRCNTKTTRKYYENRLVKVSLVGPDGQSLVTIGEIGGQTTES